MITLQSPLEAAINLDVIIDEAGVIDDPSDFKYVSPIADYVG